MNLNNLAALVQRYGDFEQAEEILPPSPPNQATGPGPRARRRGCDYEQSGLPLFTALSEK